MLHSEMKARQRWRAEEDGVLSAYVQQYGPREWHLISQRMNTPLERDAKSCLERWKNYLKPGIKKGSLTEEEQRHVIYLQAKHGNKWKKIAAEVPGRTAKRLGKWWEVFKEKQHRDAAAKDLCTKAIDPVEEAKYDGILHTFAEKLMKTPPPPPELLIANSATPFSFSGTLCSPPMPGSLSGTPTPTPSKEIVEKCRELEEGRMLYVGQKKEAEWRLRRLELQLESEKTARKKEAVELAETVIRELRRGEEAALVRVGEECRLKLEDFRETVEAEERVLVRELSAENARLLKCIERLCCQV